MFDSFYPYNYNGLGKVTDIANELLSYKKEFTENFENSTYLLINTKTKDIDKIKSSATKMFEDCIDV